jgi:predicted N-formylglutamate amidohydrolase
MSSRHLEDHIAWDIGAAGVARRLAALFDAHAVIAGYSRLVVDLNRNLKDASAFPEISDGVLVPGNLGLTPEAKILRKTLLYDAYHDAIDAVLDELAAGGRQPALIGVHSFTPRFHGTERPWRIGVLWDQDPRLPIALLAGLRRAGGVVVGDNEPYSGRHRADYSIDHHAERRRLAHVGIEIRQDLIADHAGQERWAERLACALERALADDRVYDSSQYGRPSAT